MPKAIDLEFASQDSQTNPREEMNQYVIATSFYMYYCYQVNKLILRHRMHCIQGSVVTEEKGIGQGSWIPKESLSSPSKMGQSGT